MDQLRTLVLLLFPLIILPLLCSFWVVRGIDCGGKQITQTIRVDQSGNGQFTTVQSAIDSIKQNNSQWVKVHINAGTYAERVKIPLDKPCIILEGSGRKNTTITSNNVHYIQDGYPSWHPTFSSYSSNVIVTRITFENSHNLVGPPTNTTQALAAGIYGDKAVFYKCGFLGVQDTLFDQQGRHFFKHCYIQGQTDFIFGSGQSIYQGCKINATHDGFVTAHGRRSEVETSGYVFNGGRVFGSRNSNSVYLGRAWAPYARVIFRGTYFDSCISPQGWEAWKDQGHEGNITYVEVNCKGLGNDTSNRVPWEKKLNHSEIYKYSLSNFINKDGWLDQLPISLRS